METNPPTPAAIIAQLRELWRQAPAYTAHPCDAFSTALRTHAPMLLGAAEELATWQFEISKVTHRVDAPLKDQISTLKSWKNRLSDAEAEVLSVRQLVARHDAATERVAALEGALRFHGRHNLYCPAVQRMGNTCNCGWQHVLETLLLKKDSDHVDR